MHLGLIGYGNIATELIDLLASGPVSRVTVLVRPGSEDAARRRSRDTPGRPRVSIVASADAFLASGPDLVVECAGHDAVRAHGAPVLAAGIDLVVVSVGALADESLHAALTSAAAQRSSGRMILPSGAIGGLDLLASLALAGDLDVTYHGTKPPDAWRGTAAETAVDLDAITKPTRFFEGTAREAAMQFPKNANVVAALALAGAGFDKTRVDLVADPNQSGNSHAYKVVSPLCRYEIDIAAVPSPDNPRTSMTTVWSVLSEIRRAADARTRRPF